MSETDLIWLFEKSFADTVKSVLGAGLEQYMIVWNWWPKQESFCAKSAYHPYFTDSLLNINPRIMLLPMQCRCLIITYNILKTFSKRCISVELAWVQKHLILGMQLPLPFRHYHMGEYFTQKILLHRKMYICWRNVNK